MRKGPRKKTKSLVQFLVHFVYMTAAGWVFAHCLAGASETNCDELVLEHTALKKGWQKYLWR